MHYGKPDRRRQNQTKARRERPNNSLWFVIKNGPPCIAEDPKGRSIADRLSWEYAVLRKINGIVPAPTAKALINNSDDCYLITAYIDGVILETKVLELLSGNTWRTIELLLPESNNRHNISTSCRRHYSPLT